MESVFYVTKTREYWIGDLSEDCTPRETKDAYQAGDVTETVIGIYLSEEEARSKHPEIGNEQREEKRSDDNKYSFFFLTTFRLESIVVGREHGVD